jgi:hypothetical protein
MIYNGYKCGKVKVMNTSRPQFPVQITVDQKHLYNVEYFKYLGSMAKNDAKCIRNIKPRTGMAEETLNKQKTLFTSKMDLNVREKLAKCYV